MPELPDVTVYIESLAAKARGQVLKRLRILNPFLLRTALPPISQAEGCTLQGIERLGKRLVLVLQPAAGAELLLVIHLMIAGRLRWLAPGAKPPGRITLASFEFETGQLVLTEAGTQRRASMHLLADRAALAAMDPGGLDVFAIDGAAFAARLQSENHTLKRALTNPQLFSGIGNAYSDEILHRARLSPVKLTRALDAAETARLFDATRAVLTEWTERLRAEAASHGGWPDKVTAFHPQMAVHGRYDQPCPDCGTPVQRIVHADNETNYCARCQTGGKLLADRALSRLLKASWPKHIDDL
ncbi:formamidopyrimidine-DNA glycosylase [Aquincola sp. S2]|uniref:Formamidopyrimidine-DNA glycosylase n=1 Tax=Pseudaquabacterium terrae TaxID=2732868 RepID=A0ABX2ELD1_9BURK|nr:DNA-formamidopyrimidine glycosylase family protein [Aquabacterium terrae]NRF69403.1 formamidopyrimidine-DNA glycosylase [Aquabacterium terrae]